MVAFLVRLVAVVALLIGGTACAYKGPRGTVAGTEVIESEWDGGVVVRARTPSGSARGLPVEVWLEPGLVEPNEYPWRVYTLNVRNTRGWLISNMGFDGEQLYVPRTPEGGQGVWSVAHVWVPVEDELVAEDQGTSVSLHGILSVDVYNGENIAFDFQADLARDTWASRPRSEWRTRTVGLMLYPVYGAWRDLLDIPFSAINRLGIGTTFPPRLTRGMMGRKWYLTPLRCVFSPLTLPTLVGCVGYGYGVVPVQVALLRSGADGEYVKWQDRVTTDLGDGGWSDKALAQAEELDRSLGFFPNWKYLAHRRSFQPGRRDQASLRVVSMRVRRINPVPEEW